MPFLYSRYEKWMPFSTKKYVSGLPFLLKKRSINASAGTLGEASPYNFCLIPNQALKREKMLPVDATAFSTRKN